MDQLVAQFGEVFAAVLDHPVVRALTLAVAIYVVILWLATAFWAIQDLRRRHADPGLPFVAGAGIILASPVLFPLAVIVYRVLRPGETLAESRERELADRLTTLEAQELLACPACGSGVEEDWLACPACRTRLAHQCLSCGRSMGLDWSVCAWCAAEFGEPVIPDRQALTRRAEAPEAVRTYDPQTEVASA